MFFKEPLTERFFVKLILVLLWHRLKNFLKHLYFSECNCRTDRGKWNGLPKYDPNLVFIHHNFKPLWRSLFWTHKIYILKNCLLFVSVQWLSVGSKTSRTTLTFTLWTKNPQNYQQRTNLHIERALVDLFFPQDTMESKCIYKIWNVE